MQSRVQAAHDELRRVGFSVVCNVPVRLPFRHEQLWISETHACLLSWFYVPHLKRWAGSGVYGLRKRTAAHAGRALPACQARRQAELRGGEGAAGGDAAAGG